MPENLPTYALAAALGFAIASLLYGFMTERKWLRFAILALLPLLALFGVFLFYFDGAPMGEDWLWLAIGLVYFWPWYLSWCVGWVLGKFTVAFMRSRREQSIS